MIYVFLLCGALPIMAWFVAELKGQVWLRLAVGIFAFGVVGMLSFEGGRTKPAFENEDLRACLAEIQRAFARGEFEKIDAAYRAYENDIQAGRGEYGARCEMLATLRTYKVK
jgi:hypothetical protein